MGRLISQSMQMHHYLNSIKPHWVLQWLIYCTALKDSTPSLPVVHNVTHHEQKSYDWNQSSCIFLFTSCSIWSCNGHWLLRSVILADSFPNHWQESQCGSRPRLRAHPELLIRSCTSGRLARFIWVLSCLPCQNPAELKVKNSHWHMCVDGICRQQHRKLH